MGTRLYKDSSYDIIVWNEIWATELNEAKQNNWSKTRCVDELAVKMDVSEATIWRCINDGEAKWRDDTRAKMYKYAGYNSIDDLKKKLAENEIKRSAPLEDPTLVENV